MSFRESSSSEPSARRSSEKETTTTDSRRKRDARKKEKKEKGRKKKRKKRGVSSTSPRLPKPRRFPDSPTPSLLLQLDALASPSFLSQPPIFLPHLRVQPRQRSYRSVVDDDQRLGRPRLPREGRDAVGEASPLGVGAGEGRDDDDEDFAVRGGGAEALGHGVSGDSVGRGSERVRGGGNELERGRRGKLVFPLEVT